jgi:hypothetical protein
LTSGAVSSVVDRSALRDEVDVDGGLSAAGARDAAAVVAEAVATRLADPATLAAAVTAMRRQTAFPSTGWRPETLAAGHCGLVVLFGSMDGVRPGCGWDRIAHDHLNQAVAGLPAHPAPGLAAGLAGLGLAAELAAGGRDRYRRLLAGVDAAVAGPTVEAARGLSQAHGCNVSAFDVISGLSGTGGYLVRRKSHPVPRAALDATLEVLAALLADPGEPRRWHTPAALSSETMLDAYPHGNHNCGLAHGVPGPLALLAIAALEGVEVRGGRQAMRVTAEWLATHRLDDTWGPNWANAIPLDPSAEGNHAARATWCYGSPGVARALWLAGEALDDDGYRDLAVGAVRAAVARPPVDRGITSATFCHGLAGLLAVTLRFAVDTGLPDLAAAAQTLTAELVSQFDAEALLGYRNVEPGDVRVDQPGLLDGAAGVALTLLTAAGAPATWDRAFLLS